MTQPSQDPTLDPPVGERDHVRGPDGAPVTLVEYGDYECPYCGRAHPMVEELRERLGDRLRYVFRHYPLDARHPQARPAAEAAEAAGAQGKFWEMHDKLYQNQQDLEDASLRRYALELGLDPDKFDGDLRKHAYFSRVEEDRRSGDRSGVEGTPMFYINGVRYGDSYDLEALLNAVEKAGD